MGLFGRPRRRAHPDGPIRRLGPGHYRVELPDELLEVLASVGAEVAGRLDDDDPTLARLRPFASTDPDVDRSYQELLGDELTESRRRSLEAIERIRHDPELDEDGLVRWMQGLNAVRLVLGTRLGVRDDEAPEVDPDDPDARVWAIYELLALLVDECTVVLAEELDGGVDPA